MNIIIFEHIIAIFFGICLASYTSSVFYRLPRQIPLNGFSNIKYKPFCSICHHPLKFYEYYSVLSWFFCGTKCNYCQAEIDGKFRISEAIVIFNSFYLHYLFGFSDNYLLLLLWSVALTIICSINFTDFAIPNILYLIAAFLGIMIKLDNGQQLLEWLFNSVLFSILALIIARLFNKIYDIPDSHLKILICSSFIQSSFFIWIILGYFLIFFLTKILIPQTSKFVVAKKFCLLSLSISVYIIFILEIIVIQF